MASSTRSQKSIYLVGNTSDSILGSKLPSLHQVLQYFFHLHAENKMTKRESSTRTSELVLQFWNRANVPTKDKQNVITKVEKLFVTWENLKKSKGRRTENQIQKEEEFTKHFPQIFDIAHEDALNRMGIQEDKEFLLAQRDSRRGSMGRVDVKKLKKDSRKKEEEEKREKRRRKSDREAEKFAESVEWESESEKDESQEEQEGATGGGGVKRKRTGTQSKKMVVTPELTSALDRCKVSNRAAVHVVAATAAGLGVKVSDLHISKDTIRRERDKQRATLAISMKLKFRSNSRLIVHWDGKLLPDITGNNSKEMVDRLPIIVSGDGEEQLLSVPKLEKGTGEVTATAVYETLTDWGFLEQVCGMGFDTTSANTGNKSGACVLLEGKMGKRLMSFACRHHILEIVLENVFSIGMGASSGPDIQLFKRFQKQWESLDKRVYRTVADDEYLSSILTKELMEEIVGFAQEKLDKQPRDDYKELLDLTIIFLSEVPAGGIRFRSPGAMHRARWMARLLYTFKLFMFGRVNGGAGTFEITAKQEAWLRQILLFTLRGGYIQAWFNAPLSCEAPKNDLKFLGRLFTFRTINDKVATAAIQKMLGHMWYLSEELVGLAFFDVTIDAKEKNAMVKALHHRPGTQDPPKRIVMALSDVENQIQPLQLCRFVTQETKGFFTMLGLPTTFLERDAEEWVDDLDFQSARKVVQQLKVVNDAAERGVALIQEFNDKITRNEEQKQFLLQVVAHHRKLFPNAEKGTVVAGLH